MSSTDDSNDGPDLKGMEFSEAAAALVNVKNSKGYVSKKADTSSRWSFCFSFMPAEYTEEELLELIGAEYGAGEYPVQFKVRTKKGNERIHWQKNMHVQARRLGAQNKPAEPTPAPTTDGLAAALENQTRMLEKVLEKISQPPPTVAQKTTIEFAQELGALKELFTGDKQTVLEQVKDVLELKQMLMENSDAPSDPIAAALKYLGPALEKGMEGAAAGQPQRPAPGTLVPAGAEAAPSATAAPPPGAEPMPTTDEPPPGAPPGWQQPPPAPGLTEPSELEIKAAYDIFAKQYLTAVLQLSDTKQAPAPVSAWIVRMIGSDAQAMAVVGLVITQDDMVVRLSAYDPRVMPAATWLDSVADHLAHALWPEANPAPEADTATNDATIIETGETSVINDGESQGDSENELVAGGGPPPDENANPPRAGHNNDA